MQIFGFDLRVKVTLCIAKYPIQYATYASAKFAVAPSNGLGRYDNKNRAGRTDRRTTDQLWYEINLPLYSKENADIIISQQLHVFRGTDYGYMI